MPIERALLIESRRASGGFDKVILSSLSNLAHIGTKPLLHYARNITSLCNDLNKIVLNLDEKVKVLVYRFKVLSLIFSSCAALVAFVSPLIEMLSSFMRSTEVAGVFKYKVIFCAPWSYKSLIVFLIVVNITSLFSYVFDQDAVISNVLKAILAYLLTYTFLFLVITPF